VVKSILKKLPLIGPLAYEFLFWVRENDKSISGKNNTIHWAGAQLEHTKINIKGSGNQLFFAAGSSIKNCNIEVLGNNHKLIVEAGVVLTQSTLWFEDQDCEIRIGADTTMQRNGHIAVTETGRKIEIGPRCMFSFDVDIRNGDSHTIFDQKTGKRVNAAKNIRIGSHVWLGAHTQILGGADIEENAIIGIRSLVKGPIEANSIAAGIPAKVLKTGYNWDSKRWPDEGTQTFQA
jgi:acetyltransferase-like isoleucine patch superfamily enzyme